MNQDNYIAPKEVLPLDVVADPDHPSNYQWPNLEKAEEALEFVLDHFVKHAQIIREKLEIAKEATAAGIKDLEKVCEAYDFDENMPVLKNVKSYEPMWDEILEKLDDTGINEDGLGRIESVLQRIPNTIRVHYETLIAENKRLEEAIAMLDSDEYKEAFALARSVQERPNPMSGLLPEEELVTVMAEKGPKPVAPNTFKIVLDKDED